MNIQELYDGAERFINLVIQKEIIAQGHHNSGALEDSLSSTSRRKGKQDIMEGFAIYYARYVNDGLPASSASFKQVPFLIRYFESKGYPLYSSSGPSATGLAFATVQKWKKEGMPTQASRRFSKTGSRTNFIESAFIGAETRIDEYMVNGFDFVVEEQFQKEKSEII